MTIKGNAWPVPAEQAVSDNAFASITSNQIVGFETRGLFRAIDLHVHPGSTPILPQSHYFVLELDLDSTLSLFHTMPEHDLNQQIQR